MSEELKAAAERRKRLKAGTERSQDIYGIVVDETKGRAGILDASRMVKRMMIDDERALADYAQAILLSPGTCSACGCPLTDEGLCSRSQCCNSD